MTYATGAHEGRASEPATASRRRQVLMVLRESSTPLGVVPLSERLGIHPNTVRFHLDSLVRAGQVERVQGAASGPGRPPLAFRLRPGMDPMGPRNYQVLAGLLIDQLTTEPDAPGRAIAAGRAWGRRLHTPGPARRGGRRSDGVEPLVDLLGGLGFEPERRAGDGGEAQIALRNCPFLDLVESRTHVVCPIHLGLMQGALAAANSPVTVDRLEPFAEPGLCLAHLGPAPVTSAPDRRQETATWNPPRSRTSPTSS